jgi:hypothetical protein
VKVDSCCHLHVERIASSVTPPHHAEARLKLRRRMSWRFGVTVLAFSRPAADEIASTRPRRLRYQGEETRRAAVEALRASQKRLELLTGHKADSSPEPGLTGRALMTKARLAETPLLDLGTNPGTGLRTASHPAGRC